MQMIKSIIFSLCVILLFSNQVLCQDQSEEIKPFNVTIEYDRSGMPGLNGQLKILFEGDPVDIHDFNFLIKYDKGHYNKFDIEIGKSLLNKGWDNLVVHTIDDPDSAGIKIVRISGTLDESISRFKTGDDFAIIRFRISYDRTLESKYLPIEFVWNSSEDNTIVTYPNETRIYSCYNFKFSSEHNMHDFSSLNLHKFTGHKLTQISDHHKRIINFYNGGIYSDPIGMIDVRGDLNLNEYCFEIGDLIMFKDYLLKGNSVFDLNLLGHLTLADVSQDKEIDLYDFVTYSRITNGEKVDPLRDFKQAVVSYVHENNGDFRVENDSLEVALFEVSGNVTPTLLYENIEMDYFFDGTNTKIIVFSSKAITFIGTFINFNGKIENFSYISTSAFNNQMKFLRVSSSPAIRLFTPKEGYYLINIYKNDSSLFHNIYGYFTPGDYLLKVDIPVESFDNYHYDIIDEQ